jgi:hypothetical protein
MEITGYRVVRPTGIEPETVKNGKDSEGTEVFDIWDLKKTRE